MVGGVAAATWALARRFFPWLELKETLLLAGGLGAACSETARHTIQWAAKRSSSQGPLTELLAELADAEDLVPIGVQAILFALIAPSGLTFGTSLLERAAAIPLLGAVLGAVAALLLGRDFEQLLRWTGKARRHSGISLLSLARRSAGKTAGPGAAIALDLRYTQETDKVIKELTGLRSVQTLNLFNTQLQTRG